MRDLFNSPKRRLRRAKHHISNLNTRIKKFFKKYPCVRVIEKDTDGTTDLHKIKLAKRLPENIDELAWEAVEGLRAALDQVGFAVAFAFGKTEAKSAYFPLPTMLPNSKPESKGDAKISRLRSWRSFGHSSRTREGMTLSGHSTGFAG